MERFNYSKDRETINAARARALESLLIEKGVIDMKSMITKTYPIEQTREAIQAVGDRTVLGAVITFA